MTWINVGCGPCLAPPPWVNIDRNSTIYAGDFSTAASRTFERKPDVVAVAWDLPYADHSIERIYCGHLVEHLCIAGDNPDLFRAIAEWKRVLAPGGKILIVAPDVVIAAEHVFANVLHWGDFWACHGSAGRGNPNGPPYEGDQGDVHQWSATREAIYLTMRLSFPGAKVSIPDPRVAALEWPVFAPNVPQQAAVLVET